MMGRMLDGLQTSSGDIPVQAPKEVVQAPEPEVKIPKMEFKQGIFDPAIANAAQAMFAQKKQGNIPQANQGLMPPSFNSSTTARGGRPGGA